MEISAALAIFVVYLIAQYLDWKWNMRQARESRTRLNGKLISYFQDTSKLVICQNFWRSK